MSNYKRVNTIRITFETSATRPTAMEIHHWLSDKMQLKPDQVDTIQLNSGERCIYLKVISPRLYDKLLQTYDTPEDFRYESGETTKVTVSAADTQTITVRCFNLPPEVPHHVLRNVLSNYGSVLDIRDERWSTQYLLPVNNGVKAIRMELKQSIPTSLKIANYDVNFSHPGQVQTCFRCKATTHLKENCPLQSSILSLLPKHKQANIVHASPNTASSGILQAHTKPSESHWPELGASTSRNSTVSTTSALPASRDDKRSQHLVTENNNQNDEKQLEDTSAAEEDLGETTEDALSDTKMETDENLVSTNQPAPDDVCRVESEQGTSSTYQPDQGEGTNRKREREDFFTNQMPFYLRHRFHKIMLAGDFNCVLTAKDQKPEYHPSPALQRMCQDLNLIDL
ncbi:hypothetical protein ANN_03240 [Periplaneta americana]|uniref:CCHC-type domain-containing protein n=1 Tax=Periplaneta americana TaxID=6978 RepID=A0ABQ8TYK5_PERAM|nr:hypothetical protein ANN_03240 [Periplaneta americana]